MQEVLRQQNYHLKNQITDLKNAFDLNRDILKILSTYEARIDPNQHLLMQIITRLTTVNNQAMINYLDVIHQKNQCKQQNLKFKLKIKQLQDKVARQIEINRFCNKPSQSKLLIQDQLSNLNHQLMAVSEQKMLQEQATQYWKNKYIELEKDQKKPYSFENRSRNGSQTNRLSNNNINYNNQNIARKYTSNNCVRLQCELRQKIKQNKKLKDYIQQLENKLIIFLKAHNMVEQASKKKQKKQSRYYDSFQNQKQQIRLLKYALNDIHLEKKEDDLILTVTQRFKESRQINNTEKQNFKQKRSLSWPKYKIINAHLIDSENSEYSQEQAEICMSRPQY